MAKQNKPDIRFKGFTDAWEQRKLGDNIVEYTEVTTENNQYPPLTSSRKGIFLQTEYFAGNQIASDDNTGYNIVPYGYFTYRHMSDDEVFHFNINDIVEKGIVSTLYPVFTTDENLDSRYLQYQLNYGHEFAKFAILQKQGGSRTYMYLNKLRQLHLTMPNHVEEQKAISSFFMNLDHLITLHQRKYDKLQVLKKAMLEKMFPKNGSSVPEIRFKGFTDAWEQRKLGALCVEFKSGDFISASDIAENEAYPVYGGNGLRGFTNHYNHDGEYALIGRQGALCGNVNYAVGKSYFTEHAVAVRANKTNQTRFLYYLFSTMNLGQYSGQSAQPGLAVGNLVELENVVPSKPEQEKIASFLSSLDHLITLHQRELEKLQNIKKSMLEKMFV